MAVRKKTPKRKATARVLKRDIRKKGGRRAGSGKKPFQPTDEQRRQVKMLVGFGIEYRKIIALVINPKTDKGISINTLQKHFREELDDAGAWVESQLAGSLFQRAMSRDHPQGAASAMFMLKCRFHWRQEEKIVHEIEGNTGVLIAPAMLTPAEWIKQVQKANEAKKAPTDD